ncbi:hypothetical protein [Photorhabdus temperata]|uniref:hypothetical protein n=1 Tax=Photorhabdus temperata TaxID=574560 RepID=UPI00041C24EF|nr:hypothetical protein [Photorhabdus temperata]
MTKHTESLISACQELARTANCDNYLILNEIADKLKFLRKESNDYKEMFFDSCKGLAAIARAAGIKEENDSGSPGQVIDKIESMLNIDWNFTEHPNIEVGKEIKCWAYVERTIRQFDYCDVDEKGKSRFHYKPVKYEHYVTVLIYQNKPTLTGKDIYTWDYKTWDYKDDEEIPDWAVHNDEIDWIHSVGWHEEYNHPDYYSYYEEIDKNMEILAWSEFIYPTAPEINNDN